MRLFDAHNHLQDERLAPDLEGVRARAVSAGVIGQCVCGSSEADWEDVSNLAAADASIIPAYGLHPWYVATRSSTWLEELETWLRADPRAAVGEAGLDHALKPLDEATQEEVFLAQWRLSGDLRRPLVIHGRRAWGRLADLLTAQGPHPVGIVLHSYSGGADLIPVLAKANARFSFSGAITYSNNRRGRRAAIAVPDELLLAETDAPDLPPQGWSADRESPNEPANLVRVIAALAELRGATPERIAELTCANAERLFRGGAA